MMRVKNSNDILMLKRGVAYSHLSELKDSIEKTLNCKVILSNDLPCLYGDTAMYDKFGMIHIGIQGLQKFSGVQSLKNFQRIDMHEFVGCVVAGFHEARHVFQYSEIFNQTSKNQMDVYMGLSFAVCSKNRDFYTYPNNYSCLSYEIDAERYGIKHAYTFLKTSFPQLSELDCENLILNYINEKCEQHKQNCTKYFVDSKNYMSLAELDLEFQNMFEKSFSHTYNYFMTYDYSHHSHSDDEIKIWNYIKRSDEYTKYSTGVSFLREQYLKHKTGFEDMMFLASVSDFLCDDFCRDMTILQDLDLSPEQVIGVSLPMNPEDVSIQEIQEFRQRNHVLTESEKRALELEILFGNRFDEPDVNIDNENSFSIF